MKLIQVRIERKLFKFTSHENWVSTAAKLFAICSVPSRDILCVSEDGQVCRRGVHFMLAKNRGAFPVTAYEITNQ